MLRRYWIRDILFLVIPAEGSPMETRYVSPKKVGDEYFFYLPTGQKIRADKGDVMEIEDVD